jgi:hypothetical protein
MDACRACDMDDNYDVVLKRLEAGWSLEEALELVERDKWVRTEGTTVTVAGLEFPSVMAACRHFNMEEGYFMVHMRLKAGWTKEGGCPGPCCKWAGAAD